MNNKTLLLHVLGQQPVGKPREAQENHTLRQRGVRSARVPAEGEPHPFR